MLKFRGYPRHNSARRRRSDAMASSSGQVRKTRPDGRPESSQKQKNRRAEAETPGGSSPRERAAGLPSTSKVQSGRKPLAAVLELPSSHTSSAPVLAPCPEGKRRSQQRGSGRPTSLSSRTVQAVQGKLRCAAAGEVEWVVWRLRVASSDQRSEGQLRSKIG